ncbi:MAG TPA: MBL fold metallo-hydrolase [Anaerolineales bacterium]|nr:MBL fold metallo-hydrolase [Anaerolineales bacterium]
MLIGDLELHLVSDGFVRVDAGGPFGLVPRALYHRSFPPADDNTLPMALTCLLVRSRGQTILIDTGIGEKLSPEAAGRWGLERPGGGLVAELAALGVRPEDVDVVVDTHLHADHCGGNTRRGAGEVEPAFPRASYWVQRMEWADASHPDARTQGTYLAENFDPLVRQGRLHLLHGNTQVTDQVQCVVTPGHTRGHQSVLLESGDWRGLYLADLASYALHFERSSWMTSYDVEPLETLRTKTVWRRWAAEHQAWLFFEHDPELPVGRLVRKEGSERVVAEPLARDLIDPLPTPPPPPGSAIESPDRELRPS